MSDDFAGTFDRHEIRSSVVQGHFGSWLLINERKSELRDEARERYGDDESQWPNDDLCCESLLAMQDGLEASLLHAGRQGVEEMINAIYESEWSIDMEMVYGIGARPSNGLKLAHLAVQRLHALLNSEAT